MRSTINTTIIFPLTTNLRLADAPGNVFIDKEESGLPKDSVVNVSLPAAIKKTRPKRMTKRISETIMAEVEKGVLLVLGIR
jgi:mRNA interferase MazF